jgi:HrpA-like RNA helicase
VGIVIFDEFHERNLHADLALALTLDARPALRPDLRLLVMSATLETARIAALLGGAAEPATVIASEGRAWPVSRRPRRRARRGTKAGPLRRRGRGHRSCRPRPVPCCGRCARRAGMFSSSCPAPEISAGSRRH